MFHQKVLHRFLHYCKLSSSIELLFTFINFELCFRLDRKILCIVHFYAITGDYRFSRELRVASNYHTTNYLRTYIRLLTLTGTNENNSSPTLLSKCVIDARTMFLKVEQRAHQHKRRRNFCKFFQTLRLFLLVHPIYHWARVSLAISSIN